MNAAKFYIYRNLRTGGFSVKYHGRVVDRLDRFTARDVSFKVNELGRQRVIKEQQKNVHAYAVCGEYKNSIGKVDNADVITYNPYTAAHFTCNNAKILNAKQVLFKDGKCYLIDK